MELFETAQRVKIRLVRIQLEKVSTDSVLFLCHCYNSDISHICIIKNRKQNASTIIRLAFYFYIFLILNVFYLLSKEL